MSPEERMPDPDEIANRAIESVIDQIPGLIDAPAPDASPRSQPWADNAAPPGRNKRPLEELLSELAARVEANPDAVVSLSQAPSPGEAFLERFAKPAPGRNRSRRRRRGRTTGRDGERPQANA